MTSGGDWTRFGWDARRSNDDPNATGITAANAGSLVRQQVRLPGTVDSSAIYLRGVMVGSASHDAGSGRPERPISTTHFAPASASQRATFGPKPP